MSKIIFLDIDGVCNSKEWYKNHKNEDCDINVIKRLNTLKNFDVKVVVSSSWGQDGVDLLYKSGLEIPILGKTNRLEVQEIYFCRGNSIAEWIYNNDFSEDYVIVDDDDDMLLQQKDNFIQTNPDVGLTDNDLKKIKKILKLCK